MSRPDLRARGPVSRRPGRPRRDHRPAFEHLERHLLLSLISVSTADDNGSNASPTPGSLRAAILAANAEPGATIGFAIGNGAQVIRPPSDLPTITAPLTIDGTSQPGFAGQALITLDGANDRQGTKVGLNFGPGSDGSTLKGLAVLDFKTGVKVTSARNTIGGNTAGAGNVLSDNHPDGLWITGAGAFGNVVQGNRIGTNAAGTAALANGGAGIKLTAGASGNTIGGTVAGARNTISSNYSGVVINDPGTSGNLVLGNRLGTNADGTAALPNHDDGVKISGATNNTVGGTAAGAGNLCSGNGDAGVELIDGASGNLVLGNWIGTNADGTAAIPNRSGVLICIAATDNTIGGTADAARNLISGNAKNGVTIANPGTSRNLVQGNYIGTGPGGDAALPNAQSGVRIVNGPTDNTVGGTAAGAGNLISGNAGSGVSLYGQGTSRNLVQGNRIGTDPDATAALPNLIGVSITKGATNNTIGGTDPGARNTISSNQGLGVQIANPGTSGNLVQGNRIGTKGVGNVALPNLDGVAITNGASNNTVGGTAAGAGNLIAFNGHVGVIVGASKSDAAIGNALLGNAIYGNGKLGIDLGNNGVTLNDSSGHAGPNRFQNVPVLGGVTIGGAGLTIGGTLDAAASTTFRVEFFASPARDSSGYGEGQAWLGALNVTTGAGGHAMFSFTADASVEGQWITATATDPAGNTSEFSRALLS